jgi:hypothetical protein
MPDRSASPASSPLASSPLAACLVRAPLALAGALLAALTLTGCGGPSLTDRIFSPRWGICGTIVIVLDVIALFEILSDDTRDVGNKVIWTLFILFIPVLGCIVYFLLGRK